MVIVEKGLRKEKIIEAAEKLFLKKGFQNFEISELSASLNVDCRLIETFFISKGGLLLVILSELYFEFFALKNYFNSKRITIDLKKKIFNQTTNLHRTKIDLFWSLFERQEICFLDSYLRKLFAKTMTLHFRLFLLQLETGDSSIRRMRKLKYFYYNFFRQLKVVI